MLTCAHSNDSSSWMQNSWMHVAPMTEKRDGVGVGVLGGLLYAVGGQNNDGYQGLQTLSTVESYNPVTQKWAGNNLIASMSVRRNHFGVGVIRGLLYAVGGANEDGYLSSTEAYNPATNTWALVAPMSVQRVDPGVCVLGGLLYAVGGYTEEGDTFSSVEAYNPATNSWAGVASMSVQRQGLGVGVLAGMIHAVGGFNMDDAYLASVEAYRPSNNSW